MNTLEENFEVKGFDDDDVHRIISLVDKYQAIVIRVFNNINICRHNDIISLRDYESINESLNEIINNCNSIVDNIYFIDDKKILYTQLQKVNDSLSLIMKKHGASNCDDLLFVCFGTVYTKTFTEYQTEFYSEIILKHFIPIGYKTISWEFINDKTLKSRTPSSIFEDVTIAETTETLDVFELGKCNRDNFFLKMQGAKICFKNEATQETLIVRGYFDNTPINYIQNSKVLSCRNEILESVNSNDDIFNTHYKTFEMYVSSLMLKDLLINKSTEHYDIFVGYLHNVRAMKKKSISKLCREFMSVELFEQREIIYQLLLFSDDFELQFIAYLLYDLLSFNKKETNDESEEQDIIYNSLPYVIKSQFKGAMKETIKYTNRLTNPDIQDGLPIEQRICLLKTNDKVKEKAMTKLKELKSKSEDSGSKARQYLDGLLKIPFGLYCEEPIMGVSVKNIELFKSFINGKEYNSKILTIENNYEYNHSEVLQLSTKYIQKKAEYNAATKSTNKFNINICYEKINLLDTTEIVDIFSQIDTEFNELNTNIIIPYYSNTFNTQELRDCLTSCLDNNKNNTNFIIMVQDILLKYGCNDNSICNLQQISVNTKSIHNYFGDVRKALDESVHGHKNAKKQVERIIGQWINGEPNGYCFGFEGPPGTGKTSLAKHGISKCLKDGDGNSRPFAFIAIGGSSNGSTLDGHNYTYVGSMWGKIVDILMETKCMNPIIFIDEVDKVSRTEAGREIIGILTHLVDPTQNNTYQDKYFTGIDIDLSKVLFIFSYNDVDLVDRILLDRIHRIKFQHLSLEEKLKISEDYMLPEILKKMGQTGNIIISNDVVQFIIETYTCEAGVRKLKEILFEIIGEINLELLHNFDGRKFPVEISIDDVKQTYLKDRQKARGKKIHSENRVGIINGLWANALGMGGIIPIEMKYVLSGNPLDLKLTGMQGDVMKESMNVAKTLAWSMTPDLRQERLLKIFDGTKTQGIHIHCPEGAVPKDGPSAGTAITVTMYSLLNDIKIKNTIAITGEIDLHGNVTAIGGLDLKIIGGIEAGVKEFLFPEANIDDFNKFKEKYGDKDIVNGIEFHPIGHIKEALSFALEK
jgi:ATP-dependent Lon protease